MISRGIHRRTGRRQDKIVHRERLLIHRAHAGLDASFVVNVHSLVPRILGSRCGGVQKGRDGGLEGEARRGRRCRLQYRSLGPRGDVESALWGLKERKGRIRLCRWRSCTRNGGKSKCSRRRRLCPRRRRRRRCCCLWEETIPKLAGLFRDRLHSHRGLTGRDIATKWRRRGRAGDRWSLNCCLSIDYLLLSFAFATGIDLVQVHNGGLRNHSRRRFECRRDF